ncbi:PREDICTED: transcription factor bHLH94-like [Nicotiana attenuata]|uniref:Transcription factor bhlh96 n=1 Tax=Nicotiana attenuata TaxID=49451 RepID=A0A314LGS0_NICAT|nr:PREDICTED: transcription factor bHLH94-like [Nicotiana attenuata]OIT40347.1 transcription factor bhlh96 [Nicotiana attenuata]
MALEAVTQQQQYLYALLGTANWDGGSGSGPGFDYHNNEAFEFLENNNQNVGEAQEYEDYSNWNLPPPLLVDYSQNDFNQWGQNSSTHVLDHNFTIPDQLPQLESPVEMSSTTRQRRRRTRSKKNQEEIESQRMTHIAVERNRRKQMNEYLSVLRTLMPQSYVQRGDQASIVSGAINYVKELEQQLQFLCGQKHLNDKKLQDVNGETSPFSEFFSIPQYSTTMTAATSENGASVNEYYTRNQQLPATADIEVTMVENHANLKIRSKRRLRLLPRIISGLESLRLIVLHLNVSKVDQFVLCSLSLKVEEDCKLSSVEDIAAVVNQILGRIHEEAN